MQTKPARKNTEFFVKNASGRSINEHKTPITGQIIIEAKTGRVGSRCSAILIVETKNERVRTLREYEKQRNALRSAIAR